MPIVSLSTTHPRFPDPCSAETAPDGLLAVGGNLNPNTLLTAYQSGIFPWYQDGDPLLWWSPSVRCLLDPRDIHISQSLRKAIRRGGYVVTTNCAFEQVLLGCSAERDAQSPGTWITEEMRAAYADLHRCGCAHSVEMWRNGDLVGGLYGVAVGGMFCGESMFSRETNSSKIALVTLSQKLVKAQFSLIDCQLPTPHLLSLGAIPIARKAFLDRLQHQVNRDLSWPIFDD